MRQKILSQIFLYTTILFLSFFFISCDENEITYSFEMFYLEDSNKSYSDAEGQPIQSLVLQKFPFITANNIKTYTVNYLDNNPIQSYHISLKDSVNGNISNVVRPFVLVINGKRFSLAEYWPSFMDIIPKSIHMYKFFDSIFDLHPGDDVGNAKLKDPIIINTLQTLGIEIKYRNIGG